MDHQQQSKKKNVRRNQKTNGITTTNQKKMPEEEKIIQQQTQIAIEKVKADTASTDSKKRKLEDISTKEEKGDKTEETRVVRSTKNDEDKQTCLKMIAQLKELESTWDNIKHRYFDFFVYAEDGNGICDLEDVPFGIVGPAIKDLRKVFEHSEYNLERLYAEAKEITDEDDDDDDDDEDDDDDDDDEDEENANKQKQTKIEEKK
jgi:hypothetical protein